MKKLISEKVKFLKKLISEKVKFPKKLISEIVKGKKMECHFDFNKKTISKIFGEFLSENLPNEAEHIKRFILVQLVHRPLL